MTSRDFCYWLQGFFELRNASEGSALTTDQTKMVQSHLNMVFVHEIDPSMGDLDHQEELNEIHENGTDSGNTGLGTMRC